MIYFSTTWMIGGLLVLAGTAWAQTPTFAPVATYDSGGINPYSIAVADVNGDNKPDILAANTYGSSVGVLLGSGNGTFQAASTYSTGLGSEPSSIAVADINSDNKPDLLIADMGNLSGFGSVGVLLGNGNGTFQAIIQYSPAIGSIPYDIAVADLNADGQPDIVTGNYASPANTASTVGVLLNKGNGTFKPMIAYNSSNPISITVADINGDGHPDVLTANPDVNTASVLLGNGNGTLQAEVSYSTGSGSTPHDIAVADVNGDGRPDLLTANYGTSTAGVLPGTGNGTFGPVTTYSTGASSSPASIGVADLNGDGRLDLLTANYNSDAAGVLLGNGNGTFQAATFYSTDSRVSQLSSPNSIVAADVNRDGKLDLLTANFNASQVGVLLSTALLSTRSPLPGTSASLAPNPAADHAVLTLAGLPATVTQVQVALLDATGRLVHQHMLPASQGSARAELPTASLATGLYLVRLMAYDGGGEQVGLLLTQRLSVR